MFGAHRIVLGVHWVFEMIGADFVRFLSQNKGAEPAGREKDDDSPKLNTDIDKDKVVRNEEKGNGSQA